MSIKHKTVSGVKWQVVNKVAQKVISVATFAVLARILEPATFGLMALSFVFIDGIGLFRAFGVDSSIVQRKDLPDIYKHTAFFLISFNGFIMCAICYLFAPFAGHFFKNPEVGSIIRALGIILIINCSGRISQSMLVKSLRFKETSGIEIVGSVVNSIFSIFFAWISPTVWALVWAYVMKQTTMTLLTQFLSPYRMKFQFDWKVAKELLNFGRYLVGLSVIWYASSQLGTVLIGRMLGTAAVGYYALSRNIINFINTHFTMLISNVMFPAYVQIKDDKAALKRAYLKTIKFVSVFTVPFSLGMMVMSKDICLALYGDKWLPIVPLIQLMSAVQIMAPLMASTGSIFNACGKPQYSYRLALTNLVINVPLIIALIPKYKLYGPTFAGILTSLVISPVYYHLVKKLIGTKRHEVFPQLVPSFVCSFIMIGVVFLIKHFVLASPIFPTYHGKHFLELVVLLAVATSTYFLSFYFIDRESFHEVRKLLFKAEGKAAVQANPEIQGDLLRETI